MAGNSLIMDEYYDYFNRTDMVTKLFKEGRIEKHAFEKYMLSEDINEPLPRITD